MTKDEEVKNSILQASKRVFKKWGLNKTTMEDIAREVGKGKSTLYYYFKSKDEIFHEFTMNELNSILIKVTNAISNVETAKGKLKTYLITILNEMKDTIIIYPLLRGEIKGNKEILDELLKKVSAKEEAILLDILRFGLKTKEFKFLNERNITKASNVIVGLLGALELYLFFENEDEEKVEIVTRLISEGI